MNLKRLEIIGFKSFLHRLEMDFTTGITAVLGPNGCGKTNIVDAIRWVLGEQKTRLLRNTKMENVIFNGTKLRKPVGLAEVHMTLSNQDHALPLDYNEVTISRKLYRSGVSEYYVNGELARLKDIKGLLVDSGLGSHTYSIIEREMVDSVISEKDQDKRFLLEEAAGVIRYRLQREEALRKIKHTETDLTRLRDILAELDKEQRSLRYQVGKARRYTRLKERVDKMEAVLVKRSLFELLEKKDAVLVERAHHESITLADENEISIREDRLQEQKIQAAEQERELQDLHETRYAISQSLQQHEERIAILTERIGATKNRVEEDDDEILRARTKMTSLETDRAVHVDMVEKKELEFTTAKADLVSHEESLESVSRELENLKERLRENKQRAMDIVRERERRRGLRQHFETQLDELQQKKARIEESLSRLHAEGNAIRERLAGRSGEVDQHRESTAELARTLEQSFRRSERVVELAARCDEQNSRTHVELNRLKEKKDYLERIRNEHGRGAENFSSNNRIKGTLADHISVDKKHRKCFEACLSPILQSLMAESQQDAFEILREVRGNGGGRFQFLYPNGNGNGNSRVRHARVVGAAIDLLKGDKKVIEYLRPHLADVAVVPDVDAAIELISEVSDARVATLDGVFFDGTGRIVVCDIDDIDVTLLEYDAKVGELTSSIEALQTRTANVVQRKQQLMATRAQLSESAVALKEGLRSQEAELDRVVSEQRGDEIELAKIDEKLDALTDSMGEIQRAMEEIRSELVLPAEENVGSEPANEHDLSEFERRITELEGEKETLVEKAGEVRLEVATVTGEITTAKEKLNNIDVLDNELKELVRSREEDAERCRKEITSAESEIEATKSEIAGYHGRMETVEKNIDETKDAYDTVKTASAGLEKQLKELKHQRDDKKENLQRCDLELATIETRVANLLEKARENFNQDLDPYIRDRDRFDVAEWEEFDREGLDELRSKLESFGPVNMLAVEEFEQKKERFDFLTKQKEDLEEAKDSLVQAIRRINREARRRLNETFEIVRGNFKTTFSTLFEGGEADLLFVDSDDPLEANIKIVANPKGKRLHDISSLSGGERALVALSLLFAIYLVKPSPFCVFDEVDAPLDDANIGRFVNMLKSFTNRIQFIVITHNKKTMEAANHLYGVTMQEPGVSRMVSVHIGEVDRFRDQNPPARRVPAAVAEEVPVET